MHHKQISARVEAAHMYKEKSALGQKVKKGCIKQENGMGTRPVDIMCKMWIYKIGLLEGWKSLTIVQRYVEIIGARNLEKPEIVWICVPQCCSLHLI